MAFKRSAVRSRLSPPERPETKWFQVFYFFYIIHSGTEMHKINVSSIVSIALFTMQSVQTPSFPPGWPYHIFFFSSTIFISSETSSFSLIYTIVPLHSGKPPSVPRAPSSRAWPVPWPPLSSPFSLPEPFRLFLRGGFGLRQVDLFRCGTYSCHLSLLTSLS